MSKQTEAMKLALEALEGNCTHPLVDREQAEIEDKAITALREALAEQPAQRKPLPRILDVCDTGQSSLQLVFKNRSDADEYKNNIKESQ